MRRKPRIGLALGAGCARGWAPIGAIRALEQRGIRPDLVCGTSIGALVGAAYASGELDRLENWVSGLAWTTVVRLMGDAYPDLVAKQVEISQWVRKEEEGFLRTIEAGLTRRRSGPARAPRRSHLHRLRVLTAGGTQLAVALPAAEVVERHGGGGGHV